MRCGRYVHRTSLDKTLGIMDLTITIRFDLRRPFPKSTFASGEPDVLSEGSDLTVMQATPVDLPPRQHHRDHRLDRGQLPNPCRILCFEQKCKLLLRIRPGLNRVSTLPKISGQSCPRPCLRSVSSATTRIGRGQRAENIIQPSQGRTSCI